MSKWRTLKLSEIAYLSSAKIEMQDIGLNNYISTDNMLPDKSGVEPAIKLPSAKRVSHFEKGDILFSNIRPYFKKVWFAEFEGGASADVLVWKPLNEELVTKEYLYYLLSSDEFIEYSVRTSKGVKMPRGDKEAMLSYELILPPIEVQKDIALLGRSLDHKISNNTTMNATLEKIAQRIFKSWFVDFDPVKANAEGVPFDGLSPEIQSLFPNEFEDSELGMIPKGWSASNIGKEFDVVMGQSPPGSSYNEKGEGTLFFQGRRDFGFRYPVERVFTNAPKRLAKAGDTLLSVRAPVGDVNKALRDCCVGRGVGALRHKSGCESFTYYASKRLRNIFDNFDGEGTVFGSINQTELKALKIIAPSNEVMKKFNEIATPLDERIKVNTEQINSLTKIRDKLLPRLISGKITIQKAEELLEEAS